MPTSRLAKTTKDALRLLQDHFNTSFSPQHKLNSTQNNSTQTTELGTTQFKLVIF